LVNLLHVEECKEFVETAEVVTKFLWTKWNWKWIWYWLHRMWSLWTS
jgi:hypothetical protein